ncbi:MAG TPA: DUF1573 domain-containing protein [Bacteroidia bacterium]|jgi:hypothetical protein
MKKVMFTIALTVFAVIGSKAQNAPTNTQDNPNAPEMTFESEVIDYGTVDYNSDGTREFKFKNTGKEPLIIQSATGSCGCTVPTPPKDPVKPGETAVIKVHYDTKRVGNFEKTVTVVSNSKTPSKVLKIKGVVKPDATTNTNGTTNPQGH